MNSVPGSPTRSSVGRFCAKRDGSFHGCDWPARERKKIEKQREKPAGIRCRRFAYPIQVFGIDWSARLGFDLDAPSMSARRADRRLSVSISSFVFGRNGSFPFSSPRRLLLSENVWPPLSYWFFFQSIHFRRIDQLIVSPGNLIFVSSRQTLFCCCLLINVTRAKFDLVLLGFTGFYRVLLSFT